jgi:lipopolysaccharide assembly outer membrane protein LptD (OstA)
MAGSTLWTCLFAVLAVAQTDQVGLSLGDELLPGELVEAVSTAKVVAASMPVPDVPPLGAIDVKADKLIYDRETGWIEATGNVIILNGPDKLTADYVQVNMETEEAMALGNVVLLRPSGATKGERLSYNFKTDEGHSDALSGETKPFYWVAESTEQVSTNRFVLHNAQVTTCRFKGKHRHFHIRAKELTIAPRKWMKARHAVWYFGRVPSFYTPYWFRSLQEKGCGWTFQPGYDSRLGAFLLSTYGCTLWPWLKTETHLDYYTARGPAFGQDFRWHQPGTAWSGDLETYALNDKRPWEPEEDPALSNVDENRHRIRLRHRYYPSRNSYALLQAYHLSDPDVQEDFFEGEHRRGAQPENYFTYTRRGEGYLVNLSARKRLNSFYTTLERLPELSADIFRQEIGDSRFYYEGRAAAGYLQWKFADDSSYDDVATWRGDTYHELYRPLRLFGFLNLIPRAGYRGTWYSKTRAFESTVQENVLEDGTIEEVIVEEEVVGPSGTRSLYEVGNEVSFKAFRVWDNVGAGQRTLRHVVEPFADYTYVMHSGLERDDIYQFDSVDRREDAHYAVVGLRNMLQTKQGSRARDIVDLDMYTVYQLDTEGDEDPVEDIRLDAEIKPFSRMRLDVDARYNVPDDEFSRINTRLWLWRRKVWSMSLENRYRKDRSNRWTVRGDWRPNKRWRFGSYARYDTEDDDLETAGGYIQRDWDCLALKTGGEFRPGYMRSDGTEQEDEYRVTLEFWLIAFPSTRMRIR